MKAGKGGVRVARTMLTGLGLGVLVWSLVADAVAQQPRASHRKDLGRPSPAGKSPAPTYAKDVAAILQAKCQNCHRTHQVGPVRPRDLRAGPKRGRPTSASVTEERSMPPWKPTPGVGPKLKHDQSLTPRRDRCPHRLGRRGCRAGNPKDLPAARPVTPRVGSSARPI